MQLQVALDRIDLERAVRLADQVRAHADWIEVGTSLIKRYGMRSVSEVVGAAAGTPVLADLKTADDAATEFGMALDSSARAATVLAATTDATVHRCVALARDAGAEAVLDLLAVSGRRRDELLRDLPAEVVFAPHIGKDAQQAGHAAADALGEWTRGRRVALAGGLTKDDVTRLRGTNPGLRVIVGSAITAAADPAGAAADMSTVVRGESG